MYSLKVIMELHYIYKKINILIILYYILIKYKISELKLFRDIYTVNEIFT